jgi:plastocyanin
MPIITISRDATGRLVFDPAEVTLDPTGDFVSWSNQDPVDAHQPTLQGEAADYWLDDPLPRFVAGQPAATSPAVTLTPISGTPAYPACPGVLGAVCITYVDGLHPNAGSGTLRVPIVKIDTSQGGTQ